MSDVWRRLLRWSPGTIWGSSTVWEVRLQRQRGLKRSGNMRPHHWAMSEMPGTHRGWPLPVLPAGFLRQRLKPDSWPEVQAWVPEEGVGWNTGWLIYYYIYNSRRQMGGRGLLLDSKRRLALCYLVVWPSLGTPTEWRTACAESNVGRIFFFACAEENKF